MAVNTSLMRPFDLEAAKNGGKLWNGNQAVHFRGITSDGRTIFVEFKNGVGGTILTRNLRMMPLCWIEDKPVYPGDVLWMHMFNIQSWGEAWISAIITQINSRTTPEETRLEGVVLTHPSQGQIGKIHRGTFSEWTWEKPKTKKEAWINIYPWFDALCYMYNTKEEAKYNASNDVVDTIRIKWEE